MTENGDYIDCLPGRSAFSLRVSFLFGDPILTLGGQVIDDDISWCGSTSCTLFSPNYEYPAGQLQEITATTVAGTGVASTKIAFRGLPLLNLIKPCVLTSVRPYQAGVIPLKCLAGEKFQVHALYFNSLDGATFTMIGRTDPAFSQLIDCKSINHKQSECVAPVMPAGATDWEFFVRLTTSAHAADTVNTQVWDEPDAPRIYSVSGCHSTSGDPMYLNQCVGGEILSLTGLRLNNGSVSVSAVNCDQLSISNDGTSMSCRVPTFDERAYYHKVGVFFSRADGSRANMVYLSIVPALQSQSSSISTAAIALATVFSIAGACLIVIVLAWFMQKKKSFVPMTNDSSSDVPLSEIA